MRYALIDTHGNVTNIVVWDSEDWKAPRGFSAVKADETVRIGDTYDEKTGKFSK